MLFTLLIFTLVVFGTGVPPKCHKATEVHMANASISKGRRSARIAIVEQHIRFENDHDLEGVLRTFGESARYDDEPWGEHYKDTDGVRLFYEQLMKALPDLEIIVQRCHVADDAFLWKSSFAAPILEHGVVFRRQDGESSSHFAACTRLTPMITWPGKKFTTTGDSVEATRRISRAAKRIRTNLHFGDTSRHDCTCFSWKAPAKLTAFLITASTFQKAELFQWPKLRLVVDFGWRSASALRFKC